MKALSLWNPWPEAIFLPKEIEVDGPDGAVVKVALKAKSIENRGRWVDGTPQLAQGRRLVGSTFLLHAAQRYRRVAFDETVEAILDVLNPAPGPARLAVLARFAVTEVALRGRHHGEGIFVPAPAMPFGALVGTAKLAALVQTLPGGCRVPLFSGMVPPCPLCGETRLRGALTCPKADPWAQRGAVGLVLDEVRRLPAPIRYAGSQGWFDVDEKVLKMGAT